MIELWDATGRPVAYIDEDGESVYLWNGTPVAFVSDDAVHSYRGRFLGWFDDGWIRESVPKEMEQNKVSHRHVFIKSGKPRAQDSVHVQCAIQPEHGAEQRVRPFR